MAEASAFEWTTEREVVLFEQLRHFPPFGLHRSVHLLALSSLLSHRFGLPCAPSDVALKVSLHFDTAALDAISFGRSTSRPVHLSSLAPPDAAPSPAALAVVPPSSDEPPPGDEGEGPPDKRQKRGGGSGVGGGRSKPKLDAAVAANVRRLNADFVKWETAYNAAISAEKPQISGATVWTFAAMLQLGAERAAVAIEDVFAACDAMRDKVGKKKRGSCCFSRCAGDAGYGGQTWKHQVSHRCALDARVVPVVRGGGAGPVAAAGAAGRGQHVRSPGSGCVSAKEQARYSRLQEAPVN